ncbi:DUF6801 domain-containing protein [Streptomyces sp. NPDC102441]|uniref:DUF6801 domain-containing protein n=1 Tax=Streptomyces sp. NPDC102441 TaxID=3366176 RepID=UPI0038152801
MPRRIRGRATARGGAVLAAVLVAGMVPGAQASVGGRDLDVELGYTCDFPSGAQPVKARISATLPEEGSTAEALQLGSVDTELTLPEASLAGLADSGAAAVEAETRLTVDVAQDGHSAEAVWVGRAEEAVPLPGTGDLVLAVSGDVPSVTASASGELTFTASKLTAVLNATKEDGSPAGPAASELVCTPEDDQDLKLGSVDIKDGVAETVPWPSETAEETGAGGETRDEAAPLIEPEAEAPTADEAPACAGDPTRNSSMVAYITGYANVAKLNGASKFPVACAQITQGPQRTGLGDDGRFHLYQNSSVVVDYKGRPQLPPSTATFLTFGFMPTTAKMEMTQKVPPTGEGGLPEMNIYSDLVLSPPPQSGYTEISMEFSLRLYDVKVNGVPLDVGPDCRSAEYFPLVMRGEVVQTATGFSGYQLTTGGPLTGKVTLPPFSGCGVAEDLDDLFTASISGEPGYVKQMQGAVCVPERELPPRPKIKCTSSNEPVNIPTAER